MIVFAVAAGLALLCMLLLGVQFVVDGVGGGVKTVAQLLAERAEKVKAAQAIVDAAKAEGRELTTDEMAKADALIADAEQLKARADARARGDEIANRLSAAFSDMSKPAPRPEPQQIPASKGDDQKALSSGMRYLPEEDPKAGFRGYDDFAAMVKQCSRAEGLSAEWSRRPEIVAAYGQNTFNGDEGGFLIPAEFSNQMYSRAVMDGGLRQALFGPMRKYGLMGNSIEVTATIDHDKSSTTYRYGGVIVYLVAEGAQFTRSTLKIRKQSLKLNKLGAISFCTSEELEDGGFSGADLLADHAEAMGDSWVRYALWGTGAGQPVGMFHAANPALKTTDKLDGQEADSIDVENVLDMQTDLWGGARSPLWIANRELRKGLRLLKQDIGTGGTQVPLFERGNPDTLDALPYYQSDKMKAIGVLGDIGLCDPSAYAWATKRNGGIRSDMSIHLRFDYGETAFRSEWRADGKPLWDRALTPENATSGRTESPFVILEAR